MARQTKKTDIKACEKAFQEYNQCGADIKRLEAERHVEFTALAEKYGPSLAALQKQMDDCKAVMQAYAESNPHQFQDKRSLSFMYGTIGFRLGTPKLQLLEGFTWEAVLAKVKKKLPSYVRVKEELDKQALINDANIVGLQKFGLETVQEESFFVKPATETLSKN